MTDDVQISGSSINGEEEEVENSESDEDEDEGEMEDDDDDAETSCNTPTTVRRASLVDVSRSQKPFYSEWFKGGQNSKSSSDDKEKDKESIV